MAVVAQGVTVRLGKVPILHGIDLEARAGGITAIVGPNGSGKSTLLKALSGDLSFEGRIALNGRNLADLAPWEQAARRGVLPQSQALAFPFTVIEVVRMGLTAGTGGGREQIAYRALDRVGLGHKAGETFHTLSGGEQQRAHLARVLSQVWEPVGRDGPRWLFLDEPVSNLDVAHQLQVMEIARDFARQGGGVIAVMHDLNLTAMFAARVILIQDGRTLVAGPPPRVLSDAALSTAYGCRIRVGIPPPDGAVFILPHNASLAERTHT